MDPMEEPTTGAGTTAGDTGANRRLETTADRPSDERPGPDDELDAQQEAVHAHAHRCTRSGADTPGTTGLTLPRCCDVVDVANRRPLASLHWRTAVAAETIGLSAARVRT